jgi:hypothetical protein
MIVTDRKLFTQAANELLPHASHRITLVRIGEEAELRTLVIECESCHEPLIEFLAEVERERRNPDHVRYEGQYEGALDLCHVEVFKPGKSPYPMQERQDLINHSPTGISWGYGGSGPAQCAFAILMDYFGDLQRAQALHQDFKFSVIANFQMNEPWILTGHQIEQAITKIEASPKLS